MKMKAIIFALLLVFMSTSVSIISAENELEEGLYVTVNAVDNHIYSDTDNNRINFEKDSLKKNANIISFEYSNGEYTVAVDPDNIEVTYIGGTEDIVENQLSLVNGKDWVKTTVPYSLVYQFTYTFLTDEQREENVATTVTIYVTVEEQLTLTEKYSGVIFDPLRISRAIVRLVGLNFTPYSNTEKYFEYVCDSSTYDTTGDGTDSSGLTTSCGIDYDTYTRISDTFTGFISGLYSVMLGFALILVIFRFVKGFFDTNPNQNNFRMANIIKKLGRLGIVLVIMFFLDDIMMFAVHIFSVITVAFYNLADNTLTFSSTSLDGGISTALDSVTQSHSLWGLVKGAVSFYVFLQDLVLGFLLNAVFLAMSIYIILKIGLVIIERILSITISIVLSPIFITYYLEDERKRLASRFFSKFFASLFSALILLIVSIAFAFITDIFAFIMNLAFFDFLNIGVDTVISRVATIIGYIMLMLFYVKTITKADDLAEELIVRNH